MFLMRLVVILPTCGRKELLNQLLEYLEQQTRLPDEVVISAPDQTHVSPYQAKRLNITYLYGKRGASTQRNLGLDYALTKSDVITFFDDDFLPGIDYLERLECAFEDNENWAVITGNVVSDGATGPGFSFAEGLQILRETEAPLNEKVLKCYGAYGCNMSMRTACIDKTRFDERLPLYSWQEDVDFTSQLSSCGDIVELNTLLGVHLGIKLGRVSGVRFGYSQLINPIYLIRKGTMPVGRGTKLIGRNILANIARSFWPEPYIDRRGRLFGNLLAFFHLFRGRIEPEYVLKL